MGPSPRRAGASCWPRRARRCESTRVLRRRRQRRRLPAEAATMRPAPLPPRARSSPSFSATMRTSRPCPGTRRMTSRLVCWNDREKEKKRERKRETRHCFDGGRRRTFLNAPLNSISLFFALVFETKTLYSQVYTASLDGTVRLWAWATGECLETFKVGVPITGMVSFLLFFFPSFVFSPSRQN